VVFETMEQRWARGWKSLTESQQNDLIYYWMLSEKPEKTTEEMRHWLCISDSVDHITLYVPDKFTKFKAASDYLKRIKYKPSLKAMSQSVFWGAPDSAYEFLKKAKK